MLGDSLAIQRLCSRVCFEAIHRPIRLAQGRCGTCYLRRYVVVKAVNPKGHIRRQVSGPSMCIFVSPNDVIQFMVQQDHSTYHRHVTGSLRWPLRGYALKCYSLYRSQFPSGDILLNHGIITFEREYRRTVPAPFDGTVPYAGEVQFHWLEHHN